MAVYRWRSTGTCWTFCYLCCIYFYCKTEHTQQGELIEWSLEQRFVTSDHESGPESTHSALLLTAYGLAHNWGVLNYTRHTLDWLPAVKCKTSHWNEQATLNYELKLFLTSATFGVRPRPQAGIEVLPWFVVLSDNKLIGAIKRWRRPSHFRFINSWIMIMVRQCVNTLILALPVSLGCCGRD